MTQTLEIRLQRPNRATPWGFRLHGGSDFASPLLIQKVNPSSVSESCGLNAGDVVICVNNQDVTSKKHKEAQEDIVRSGDVVSLTIQRGGLMQKMWKPDVKAVGQMASGPTPPGQTFTKTSLAHNQKAEPHWDVRHNQTAKGFTSTTNASNNQLRYASDYNCPSKLYSEESKMEEATRHSMMTNPPVGSGMNKALSDNKGLCKGGFTTTSDYARQHIRPRSRNGMDSEELSSVNAVTLDLVRQEDAMRSLTPQPTLVNFCGGVNNSYFRGQNGPASTPTTSFNGVRSVQAPSSQDTGCRAPPGSNQLEKCFACDRILTGVFLKASGRPLHAECFVCATCNTSLKNTGFYNINDKLYCEAHSRIVQANIGKPGSNQTPMMTSNQGLMRSNIQGAGLNQPFQQQLNNNASNSESSWTQKLNVNKAGAASNAYDFTKQFMSDLKGNGSSPPGGQIRTPMNTPAMPTGGHQQQHRPRPASANSVPINHQASGGVSHNSNGGVAPPNMRSFQGGGEQAQHVQQNMWKEQQQNKMRTNNMNFQKEQNSTFSSSSTFEKTEKNEMECRELMKNNTTGKATNAQDFTSSFMKDLAGGQNMIYSPAGPVPQMNKAGVSIPQPQGHQHQKIPITIGQQGHHQWKQEGTYVANQQNSNQSIPSAHQQQNLPAAGPGQCVTAPRRGKGELIQPNSMSRTPLCGSCNQQIRGPFIMALNKTWCPGHFLCSHQSCNASLMDGVGFVEEQGQLYCEACFGRYFAPECEKCRQKILGNVLKAMNCKFHPECFVCSYCGKIFANSPFYMEDGLPYCEADWNELFTTKCISCGFPIEAGDKWVQALDNDYHSQCFNCTLCKKNLEGQKFFVKAGKPFCSSHANKC